MNAVHRQLEERDVAAFKTEADALKSQTKPPEDAVTLASMDEILTGIESDLESADTAPTAAQIETVAEAEGNIKKLIAAWSAVREGGLADLNRKLAGAGAKPIEIPPHAENEAGGDDDGEDLP